IEVNAACRPSFLRESAALSCCRNARYDESCVSSRNGTSSTLARLAKLLRMRFFSVNEYDCAVVTSVAIQLSGHGQTGRERCTPWRGGWPLPTAGGRRRRICHIGTCDTGAPSDHACLLQSLQKTKRRRLVAGRGQSALLRLREGWGLFVSLNCAPGS